MKRIKLELWNEANVRPVLTLTTMNELLDYIEVNGAITALPTIAINEVLETESKGSIRWNTARTVPTIDGNCILYVYEDKLGNSVNDVYIIVEHFDDVMTISAHFKGGMVYSKIALKLGR